MNNIVTTEYSPSSRHTIRTIIHQENGGKPKGPPVIVKWKGVKMVRGHSIRSTVYEITEMVKTLDVVKINIVGDPGTGKTTLAKTIAHLVHKMSRIPFAVRVLNSDDLLNFEETLKTLSPTNYVIIFDDVSFMGGSADRKQIEKVKEAFTKIRHLEGGQDIKIIAIFNIHYSKALDKYLRMCNFEYFTSIGNSETENLGGKFGKTKKSSIYRYQKIWQQAYSTKKFTYQLSKKYGHSYKLKDPFVPLLFHNMNSVRHVVSPKREWIDPICSKCSDSDKETEFDKDIEEIKKDVDYKFNESCAKKALRILLLLSGYNAEPKRVQQAMKYWNDVMEQSKIKLEDVGRLYGLETERKVMLHASKKLNLSKSKD